MADRPDEGVFSRSAEIAFSTTKDTKHTKVITDRKRRSNQSSIESSPHRAPFVNQAIAKHFRRFNFVYFEYFVVQPLVCLCRHLLLSRRSAGGNSDP